MGWAGLSSDHCSVETSSDQFCTARVSDFQPIFGHLPKLRHRQSWQFETIRRIFAKAKGRGDNGIRIAVKAIDWSKGWFNGIREVDCQMKVDNSRVMTVKELSDYLKVHPSTVYRQLKRGQLPAFKVGSDWRFNVESIDRWRLEQDAFGPNGDGH